MMLLANFYKILNILAPLEFFKNENFDATVRARSSCGRINILNLDLKNHTWNFGYLTYSDR